MKQNKNFYLVALNFLALLGLLVASGCGEDDDPTPDPTQVIVDAGEDITIELGETANLNGSAEGGNTLIYLWEVAARPAGSVAFIADPISASTSFIPDVVGEYTIRLTTTNESLATGSDELLLIVEMGEAAEEIGGTIDTDRTLVNRFTDPTLPDYIASTSVFVSAALTIEPGVHIIFEENVGVAVSPNGELNAVGTSAEPILFTGVEKSDGFWRGVEIESNNNNNELTYTTVEYGGSSGFDGAGLLSNVIVQQSGRLKITNSTFRNSGGYGLYIRSQESTLPEFANNVFTSNVAPIRADMNHYHFLDVASDYTGNDDDYIDSYWSSDATSEDVTWNALNVPYRLPDRAEFISSDITIMAGSRFISQPSGGLDIGPNGSLNAVGTADNIITFSGEQDVRGYWKGLEFNSNNTNNELTHVLVTNGGQEGFDGANNKANILVQEGRLKMTNTTSSKSDGYGLWTNQLESALPEFANNTITDNVAPVRTQTNHYHYFDVASDYTGNDDDYLDSYWSGSAVSSDATWNALNVPYRLPTRQEGINADITIMPGANFIGQPNSGLEVTPNGSLNANGTSSDRITFLGEQNVTGYWKGLRFESNNPNNVLNHVTVSNGGEAGFDGANRRANIEVGTSGFLSISNSEVSNSGDIGMRIQNGGSYVEVAVTYSGNVGVDVFED